MTKEGMIRKALEEYDDKMAHLEADYDWKYEYLPVNEFGEVKALPAGQGAEDDAKAEDDPDAREKEDKMTLEMFNAMMEAVKTMAGAVRGMSPTEFMTCMGMLFDEYCAESGADPVELARTVAECVEGVNTSEGPYRKEV